MALLRLNGEGRLCLRSATGAEGSTETHLLKDVLLLIDVSGSMSGERRSKEPLASPGQHTSADVQRLLECSAARPQ
jgi:hypothetical protein